MADEERKGAPSPRGPRAPGAGQAQGPGDSAKNGEGKEKSASPSPLPTLSLPKGGGAIRGIGEKFAVNPVTGTGSLTVPIASSPGRSGFGPQLALSYDSGSGNGAFGLGFTLGLPTITRKTDKGLPRYLDDEESDTFLLAGAEDLVPVLDDSLKRVALERTVHGVAYSVHRYRPRIEGPFSRIERWVDKATGLSHWRTISRDNVTSLFGIDEESRVASPDDPRRIFSYLLARTFDDKGNLCVYRYVAEDGAGIVTGQANERNRTPKQRTVQRYLKSVQYGHGRPYYATYEPEGAPAELPPTWHFELVFDYGDHTSPMPTPRPDGPWPVRPDPFSKYRAGFEVRTYRRCRRALMFHHFPLEKDVGADCLVRSTDMGYSDDAGPNDPQKPLYSLVRSVQQTGYRRKDGGYLQRSLPPLEFDYTDVQVHADVRTLDAESLASLPEGLGAGYQFADIDGDGLPSLLTDLGGGAWGFKRNLSPLNQVARSDGTTSTRAQFGPLELVRFIPSRHDLGGGGQRLMDLSGDGELDVVTLEGPVPGFFERTEEQHWLPFRSFVSLPQLNWSDPDLKFVDLTGDGLSDVLVTEDDVFTFYRSRGAEGFDAARSVHTEWDEEKGPRTVHSDDTQSIVLADLSGDGLSDLVRIRNGEVCYWPNLGYGQFGAKVTMDHAPRFAGEGEFDPKRIRLADIDGSGTTDLLYVGRDGVLVCFNQSGNAWADPQTLAVFPSDDAQSSVQATDLLGNGTACLVWSTSLPEPMGGALRYVDVMGGQKPHLMIRTRNNLGAETRLSYAPSTKFYLADKLAGRPWITHLPHVVHVLERVEAYDFIGRSRFVTRYAYHHGHFDGFEREFRGFGMVEQWDTEEFRETTDFPEATNWDKASWSPPLLTKTWFHTGATLEGRSRDGTSPYAHEYWTEPALRDPSRSADRAAMELPGSVLPEGLDADEAREAQRALKGSTLRVEVYADDGSPRAAHPYTVIEQSFTVRRLQSKGSNRHGCFHVHPREKLALDYERRAEDPRVTHDVTLAVDAFGNVLGSISVGYPRREGHPPPEPALAADVQSALAHDQARLHVSTIEHAYTNAIGDERAAPGSDAKRNPAPCETQVSELTGLSPALAGARLGVTVLFRFDELERAWLETRDGHRDVPFEEIPGSDVEGQGAPASVLTRRVVDRSRILYRTDALDRLLPLGGLESRALQGESYRRAVSPTHLARVFGPRVSDATMIEGGYVRLADGPDWWAPSGRVSHSIDPRAGPNDELIEARAHFFAARRTIDPFGASSEVTYDPYDLQTTLAKNAAGDVTRALIDYRVLAVRELTDPNGNRADVAFDALGLVVGLATMGKVTEVVGDSLVDFDPDLDPAILAAHLADPFARPSPILGRASTRFVYDAFAYQRTRASPAPSPILIYSITRETAASELGPLETSRFQHVYSYADGFGREIQQKTQAARLPGDAPARWVGTAWTILDNKGSPVRTYEPFFTTTQAFEFAKAIGVSTIAFYDPLGRAIAVLHPDDTWEKTVFDPWRRETWDACDTILLDPRADSDVGPHVARLLGSAPGAFQSWHARRIGGTFGDGAATQAAEKRAALLSEQHAATPSVTHFDARGRACLDVADNGAAGRYAARTARGFDGTPLAVFDALGRRALETFVREDVAGAASRYVSGADQLGASLFQRGADTGARRAVTNVAGNAMRGWDARGFASRTEYDALQRPVRAFVTPPDGAEILAERIVYGESSDDGGAARNQRGRKVLHYDSAGELSFAAYDFRGNLITSARRLARGYSVTPDWTALGTPTTTSEIAALASALLEDEAFATSVTYDGIGRPRRSVAPDQSVTAPRYDDAGHLAGVDVQLPGAAVATPFVASIEYDAKGLRTRAIHGNGAITRYAYDPFTHVLVEQITTRATDGVVLQRFRLTCDAATNIVEIRDDADPSAFFAGATPTAAGNRYEYDSMYRLVAATGREHPGQQMPSSEDSPLAAIPHANDVQGLRAYSETYDYDAVGNLRRMIHRAGSSGWTRRFQFGAEGNRLERASMPGDRDDGAGSGVFTYDLAGNATGTPELAAIDWDHANRMVRVDLGGGGVAHYTYDTSGSRTRKVVERPGGLVEERIYLGSYEVYRRRTSSSIERERTTLHVFDDRRRVAMIETATVGGSGTARARYEIGNHLGSSSVELDETGKILTYEEYFPFGATSFRSADGALEVSAKRYRYTGKERDDETGLYYHGARYYAPWLARWMSADPSGPIDGLNLYVYCRNHPVNHFDPTGNDAYDWISENIAQPLLGKPVGEFATGVLQGQVDTAVGLGQGLLSSAIDPVGTTIDLGEHLVDKYKEGAKDDGVLGGIATAANELNPVYHMLVSGYEAYQAFDKHEYRKAGFQTHKTVFHAVETVAIVADGAGIASDAIESIEAARAAKLAEEARIAQLARDAKIAEEARVAKAAEQARAAKLADEAKAAQAAKAGAHGGGAAPPPTPHPPPAPHAPKPAGQFRDAKGRFAKDPNAKPKPPKSSHGNTVDDRPATLYKKYDKHGNFEKHGITQHENPTRRYTKKEIDGGRVDRVDRGPRHEIIKKERHNVETDPGPKNFEPWAGKRKKKP